MNKTFTVLNHSYDNTGGGCMVSTFTVYDKIKNVTRFVMVNEEGFNYQTMDLIGHEPPAEITYDEIYLYSINWDQFSLKNLGEYGDPMEEYELFQYCRFEYYKKEFYVNGAVYGVYVDELPTELFESLTAECVAWHRKEHAVLYIHGDKIALSDECRDYLVEQQNRNLDDIKQFREWFIELSTPENVERLDSSYFTICVDGNSVKIPWNADTYGDISELLKNYIEG